MTDYPQILLRLTVIWAALLLYYFVALRRSPLPWQRVYLLLTLVAGLIIPVLPTLVTGGEAGVIPAVRRTVTAVFDLRGREIIATDGSSAGFPWLIVLYVSVALCIGARSLVQSLGRRAWRRNGSRSTYEGYEVITHPAVPSPHAAYGKIYLPSRLVGTELYHTALLHESSHLRHRHHYDLWLLEIVVTLLWFHPLAWLFHHRLSTLHEYQADAEVTKTLPHKTYGLQLIRASQSSLRLGLFSSPLQNRIAMLTQDRSPSTNYLFVLLAVLLAGGLCLAFSDLYRPAGTTNTAHARMAKFTPRLATLPKETTEKEARKALLELLYQNVDYPAANRDNGMEGKASMTLIIGTSGEIQSYTIGADDQPDAYHSQQPYGDLEAVVISYQRKDWDAPPADSNYFADEMEKLVELLKKVGFLPPLQDEFNDPIEYTIQFKFKLEK